MTLTRRSTLSLLGLSLATGLFGTRAHAAAPGTISTADLAAMLKDRKSTRLNSSHT